MSYSNEDYIEELMWLAHNENIGDELIKLVDKYTNINKLSRVDAFTLASKELGLKIPD
jgi:hypothetical protein